MPAITESRRTMDAMACSKALACDQSGYEKEVWFMMKGTLDLNGVWQVSWTEGLHGRGEHACAQQFDRLRYIDLPVPCELHRALTQVGILEDPNVGLNSLKARWVEEQLWIHRREFTAPEQAATSPAWLVFEGLDLNATIYLNGEQVGRHHSAHRPCRVDVSGKLKPGENTVAVVVESGLYDVADREGAAYNTAPETLLNKRHWMRKPQYQAGWDWNPRLINVGIVGDVRLEWGRMPWIDQLVVLPHLDADLQKARLLVRAHVHNPVQEPISVRLRAVAAIPEEAGIARGETEMQLPAGASRIEAVLSLERPHVWWPVGHGDQPLYDVAALLDVDGETVSERRTRTGVRRVEIDRSPHPDKGQYFIIRVNGRPIFCKGGNWVPPDMLTPGIPRERYRDLVRLAVEANCNLLRVWGGGYYVGDELLDFCDEQGVLVWHDLAFACSKYPADSPEFMAEVGREITWNVRDMAGHPSLIMWCGNNELEWGAWAWGYTDSGKALPDYALFHHVIPVIVKEEDPSRPYWPSSPYSADHVFPNDPTTGDQHPWGVTLGEHGTDFWAYREFVDRFPNEGGVLGATCLATLRECLGEGMRFRSPEWEHHDNAANFWRPDRGVTYEAVDYWLGLDPEQMDIEDYCFASGLLQAEGLQEYISNYRRRMFSSSSAVFWMYNDSWPATHGWTIVDYYLRRKLAYHPVRRAFAPVTVVLAEEGDTVNVFGVNDTPQPWEGVLRFGLFLLSGDTPADETQSVTIPANCSTALGAIPLDQWQRAGLGKSGAFATLAREGQVVAQHRLLKARFRDLELARPNIRIAGDEGLVRLQSDAFAWGVCLDMDGEAALADNLFDMIPGVEYSLPWDGRADEMRILRTGNDLLL